MPLAVVCAIHRIVSAAGFATWRQVIRLFAYEPVTLVMVRPLITACATRPCWAQSQIGVSPERP